MPLSECTRACASLARTLHIIDSTAGNSYVVGGFIRDGLLERAAGDIDVVVRGDAFAVAQTVARELGGSFVPLDQEHCIARVVLTSRGRHEADRESGRPLSCYIDFARYEGAIETDLARRDLTVNAMAMPVATVARQLSEHGCLTAGIADDVLDPLHGLRDMADRTLRACGPDSFKDDPGRLLRAARLARELAFRIEPSTESAIRDSAHLVPTVAAERTREELLKILSLPQAAESIRRLDDLRLLAAVMPEMESCRAVEQPTCHFWDVLEHSLQTIATFEFIIGESDWKHGNEEMLDFVPPDLACGIYHTAPMSLESSRATLIKLACLLHDVAKPQTKMLDDSGRARFLGHAQDGATVARNMLQRLRFSTQETTFVETLVRHHLRPSQMSTEGMPTSRAVYRFFRDTAGAGIGVLYLAMADYLACRGPLFTMSEWRGVCALVDFILREHERQEAVIAPARIIDGYELMRELELRPGPTIGVLLETIKEAQAAGLVDTRDDALTLARKTLQSEHFTVRTSK